MKNEMSPEPEPNDPFDELLRGADEYIADNGFTARVLTSLPARRNHAWHRLVLLAVAILMGAALFAWRLHAAIGLLLGSIPRQWSDFHWQPIVLLVPVVAALASLIWAVFLVVGEED